jgi:hypothetical protein
MLHLFSTNQNIGADALVEDSRAHYAFFLTFEAVIDIFPRSVFPGESEGEESPMYANRRSRVIRP